MGTTEANWRRLGAAVLLRAALDAQEDGDPDLAAPARRWLRRVGAGWVEQLDIPSTRVTAWVAGLDALPWEQLALPL